MMVARSLVSLVLLWIGCPFARATDRPIIGIVTQELCSAQSLFPFYDDFISASYIKATEAAGAQVVAIPTGQSRDYYKTLMSSINGIVIPGGSAGFKSIGGYFTTSKILYELAVEMNQRIRFPVLGVCLGFQFLIHVSNKENELRKRCNIFQQYLPLQFERKSRHSSLLLKTMPTKVMRTLRTNCTYHVHNWCHYPEDVEKSALLNEWKVLATAKDNGGKKFLAMIEHKKYPFLGVSFHTEALMYEWKTQKPRTHSIMEASRFFYDWFVSQARLNENKFPDIVTERRALIHNNSPLFTVNITGHMEMYLFKTRWGSTHAESTIQDCD